MLGRMLFSRNAWLPQDAKTLAAIPSFQYTPGMIRISLEGVRASPGIVSVDTGGGVAGKGMPAGKGVLARVAVSPGAPSCRRRKWAGMTGPAGLQEREESRRSHPLGINPFRKYPSPVESLRLGGGSVPTQPTGT